MIVRIKTFLSVYICTLHLISNFISIILYIICVSLLSEIERNKPFEHGIVVSLYFNMKCKLSIPSHRSKKKRMYTRISTKSESFPLQDALFWEIFSFFFCIFRSLAFFFNRCLDTSQVLSSNVNYERNAKNKRKANSLILLREPLRPVDLRISALLIKCFSEWIDVILIRSRFRKYVLYQK